MLSIGQMATLCQTSIQTLRLYDQDGLLVPVQRDPRTGYRYYQNNQIFKFNVIKYLQRSGLTLQQIRHTLTSNQTTLVDLWQQQEQHIQQVIQEQQRDLQLIQFQQRQARRLQQLTQHLHQGPYRWIASGTVVELGLTTTVTPLDAPDQSVAPLDQYLLQQNTIPNLEYSFSFPLRHYHVLKDIHYQTTFKTPVLPGDLPNNITVRHYQGTFLSVVFPWSTSQYLTEYHQLYTRAMTIASAHGPVYERSFPLDYGQISNDGHFITELSLQLA